MGQVHGHSEMPQIETAQQGARLPLHSLQWADEISARLEEQHAVFGGEQKVQEHTRICLAQPHGVVTFYANLAPAAELTAVTGGMSGEAAGERAQRGGSSRAGRMKISRRACRQVQALLLSGSKRAQPVPTPSSPTSEESASGRSPRLFAVATSRRKAYWTSKPDSCTLATTSSFTVRPHPGLTPTPCATGKRWCS